MSIEKALVKYPIKEVMDYFIKTWELKDGKKIKSCEYHIDVIKEVVVFDLEIEKEESEKPV